MTVIFKDPRKRPYLNASGGERPLKSPIPPATIESARHYRLARLRQQLQRHDCAAALLYDPVNIRYALDASNMQVWTLHNAYRYALIFADGPAIMFEFKGCEHLCRGLPGIDEIRPSISWIYMAAAENVDRQVKLWAGEIVGLLRLHGGGNKRIAIDRIDPLGLKAVEQAGYVYVEGQELTEKARAIKSPAEIEMMGWAIRVCEAGLARMYENSLPGKTEQEIWAELHFENARSGGEWIETRLLKAGAGTNPWYGECSDYVCQEGEMIAVDTDSAGGSTGFIGRIFRSLVLICMRFRYLTIAVTLGLFVLAVIGAGRVQKQFFPASDRPELLVTLTLNKNASIFATQSQVDRVQKLLDGDPEVERYSVYIGGGAIRFYLPLDAQLDNSFLAQFVVVGKGIVERDAIRAKLNKAFARDFPDVNARVSPLEMGPPVGWPVQYRVSAETTKQVRAIAEQLAQVLRASPDTLLVNFDWGEKSKTIRLAINQDKVRQSGLSSDAVAQAMSMILSGTVVTQLRDSIYLIDVVARAPAEERLSLEELRNTRISLPTGQSVPLGQFATIEYTLDESYIWRRDGLPTITVQADVPAGIQAPTAYQRNAAAVAALRAKLPPGARIVEGGSLEKSAQANASIAAQLPLMIMLMLIILMIQLQSFQRLFIVLSVAPLGLIGIVAIMLSTNTPMGFVATLGIVALAGMIIRNSVILVDQIEHYRAEGKPGWEAVLDAADHRLRPILLTAAAAILGMIPIMPDVFWGPMAYAIAGGLAGATFLTMLFLPALYVAWFRIKEPLGGEKPQLETQLN